MALRFAAANAAQTIICINNYCCSMSWKGKLNCECMFITFYIFNPFLRFVVVVRFKVWYFLLPLSLSLFYSLMKARLFPKVYKL